VQDAVTRALERWPRDGVPDNPAAWLTTTAQRRAVDILRRRRTEHEKLEALGMAVDRPDGADDVDPYAGIYADDGLRLVFTCCHPALPLAGQVALTLKTVAGLSTAEIARAFLVTEATMSQRLLRTKNKIAHTGIRLRVPGPEHLADRTAAVLAVVYLIFNEGYGATAGETERNRLADEAVRLAALLTRLLPGDDEVHGLRALLLLQHARSTARTDAEGDLVPMEDQDRSRWDAAGIAAGLNALATARAIALRSGGPPGPYQLQAHIAALHATAPSAAATDWPRVVAGYDALLARHPSPVVGLNRAVAIAFRDGPDIGLAELDQLGDQLRDYPLLSAVRADLLRRAGRRTEAVPAYRAAIAAARTDAERRLLQRRLAETEAG
jgi:RNA polymerase sigma-70 factor (ECF subfamily)